MGTDIHCWVEKFQNGAWHLVMPQEGDAGFRSDRKNEEDMDRWGYTAREKLLRRADWDIPRNYDLFAMLADVRNGRGFAGCNTGEGFVPILPMQRNLDGHRRGWPRDASEELQGEEIEHSPSWLRLSELLKYDWSQKTMKCGVISLPEYIQFRETRPLHGPEEYCSGVFGQDVETLTPKEADALLTSGKRSVQGWTKDTWSWRPPKGQLNTVVQVEWGTTYSYASGNFYSEHLPSLKRVAEREGVIPENLRLVFYFDS